MVESIKNICKYNSFLYKRCMKKTGSSSALGLATKSGFPTTKDIINLNSIKEDLSNADIATIKDKIEYLKSKINNIAKNNLKTAYCGRLNVFYKKEEDILPQLLHMLKLEYFKYKLYLDELIKKEKKPITLPYINKTLPTNTIKGIQLYNDENWLLEHPREKIKEIIGENIASDNKKIIKTANLYSNSSITNLLKLKFELNNSLAESYHRFSNKKILEDFTEIKKIKDLALKYDSINFLLESNNIHSCNIESILNSSINLNANEGNVLSNKEIVLKKIEINDKELKKKIPAIITYLNTDKGLRFRIYNIDINKELIQNKIKHYIKTENFSEINSINSRINTFINNIKIGEVFIEKLDYSKLKKEMDSNPISKYEDLREWSNKTENFDAYYIKNLQNFNPKKYYGIAKTLINTMKEFGKINNIKKAIMESMSFNNATHSPTYLYMRAGCVPISNNNDSLIKQYQNNDKLDIKKPIWLEITL